MIEPLLVALCGALDRIRGDSFDVVNKAVDKSLYGWLIAALCGYPFHWLTLPIIAAMYAGASPGWGNAIGPALTGTKPVPDRAEWWQVGPLLDNAWLSLVARGAMWGAPFAALIYYDPRFALMIPVIAIAMPLAVFLARHFARLVPDLEESPWTWQEYFRGWLVGLMTWGIFA